MYLHYLIYSFPLLHLANANVPPPLETDPLLHLPCLVGALVADERRVRELGVLARRELHVALALLTGERDVGYVLGTDGRVRQEHLRYVLGERVDRQPVH